MSLTRSLRLQARKVQPNFLTERGIGHHHQSKCLFSSSSSSSSSRGIPDYLAQVSRESAPHYSSQQKRALEASFVETGMREKMLSSTGGDFSLASLDFSPLKNEPGSLRNVLDIFQRHDLNLTHIESRPSKRGPGHDFSVDLELDHRSSTSNSAASSNTTNNGVNKEVLAGRLDAFLRDLRAATLSTRFTTPMTVPWFPINIRDIDKFSTKTLDAGAELEADHPGFKDLDYRERRRRIVEAASTFKHGESIPRVAYSKEEIDTWGQVYAKLRTYTKLYAVDTYNQILPQLEKHCGYGENNIPQLQDISDFLKSRTGFTLRPVGGLLSARDFLNGLAFRVFFSTQYIRHHSRPLYTPEPDICHELMGHAPMFADAEFADFSQDIGLASLGASDEDIKRLATCYWFSVEFGVCLGESQRADDKKAYGAGLLSSFGEIAYACAPTRPAGGVDSFPEYREWEPLKAAQQGYPITTYQPVYYVAKSLADAKAQMREFCENQMSRKFSLSYIEQTESVKPNRALVRGPYVG
jgi:phenylalanine-4-hydroxylase